LLEVALHDINSPFFPCYYLLSFALYLSPPILLPGEMKLYYLLGITIN